MERLAEFALGAGEILLTRIDRDGRRDGDAKRNQNGRGDHRQRQAVVKQALGALGIGEQQTHGGGDRERLDRPTGAGDGLPERRPGRREGGGLASAGGR